MATDPDVETLLAAYLQRQDQKRADRVQATLATMTDRERRLVREVAVMAYVRGQIAGQCGEEKPPPDSQVVSHVIACLHDMPDLYPTINALTKDAAASPDTEDTP